ncbi:somatostatin 1, tandem duplicate 1 [Myripristis murdjan]|uniref:Somatostatin 1, tandem duplicate 1 n=1 Tax=Myripristis murdjan TaxID=586833 RepID=A0A667ZAG8_9TELE|nr:somatostatin-1-like [Myripristis murdjan]
MVSPRLRCLLLLLSLTASFSSCSAAQRDSKLRLLLQRSPLGSKQDVSRSSVAELLADLLQVENEALEEDFPLGGEPEDVHVDLERAAGPLLAPRERKAGCKNFFWKTFTSC